MSPACFLGEHDTWAYEWSVPIVPSELSDREIELIMRHKTMGGHPVFADLVRHVNGCSFSTNWTRSGTWRCSYAWRSS